MKRGAGGGDSLDGFAGRLCDLMLSLVRREISREGDYLNRGIIAIPQLHVLLYLAGRQGCRMHDIAAALNMKGSTLTGWMDRLVELGFVRRFNSDVDRRAVLAEITAKGEEFLHGLREARKRMVKRAFGHVSAGERRTYLKILEKVAASAQAQGEADGDGEKGRVI